MRRASAALAVLAGLLIAGSARPSSTAATIPGQIIPGVGIGKLKLGMPEAAARRVLRALGPATRYRRQRRPDYPTPAGYREYQYPRFEETFGAASYIVGFMPRRGVSRLVWIRVATGSNATAKGVRVSSPLSRLRAAYGQLPCRYGRFDGSPGVPLFCRLGSLMRRHTVFVVVGGDVYGGRVTEQRVANVVVREPFVPLEE